MIRADDIEYTLKKATEEAILQHLQACDNNFLPPLSKKINLQAYAKKIYDNTVTFEAWDNNILIGLVAAYFNDTDKIVGFITNVSTIKEYGGQGIASKLMNQCILYGQQHNFESIHLEVFSENRVAFNLYKKFGFTEIAVRNNNLLMKFDLKKTKNDN